MLKKEILYPVFLACCMYLDEPLWKSVFEDLAYGICPYECFINKGYLCCSNKTKGFIYNIKSKKEPKLMCEEIKKLFMEKLNILNTDIDKCIDCDLESNIKWSQIKRKNIRDFMILNFLVKNKRDYNLSKEAIDKLQKTIKIGIIFKTISNEDIIMENGHIKSINNIEINNDGVTYNKDFIKVDENTTNTEIYENKTLLEIYYQTKKN